MEKNELVATLSIAAYLVGQCPRCLVVHWMRVR